jgi:hypothetical protein
MIACVTAQKLKEPSVIKGVYQKVAERSRKNVGLMDHRELNIPKTCSTQRMDV